MKALEEAWEEAREGLLLHQDRQVVYLNPKAAQLLGVNREKVVGRPLLLALRDHRLEALALHGGERLLEVRDRLLLAKALPGKLYLLDQTEVQRRLKDLQEAAETLAHELRTPLTVLLGHLARLERNPQDLEGLRTARATAERMRRLVGDLLDLARGEVGFGMDPHILDLKALALEAAREQGVACEGEEAEVLGDPDRLLQMLRNLIANAVRAAGKEGVRVSVRKAKPWALLEVEDRGPGIPQDLLPHLFQRFRRGPGGGAGLGLAVAQAIARTHGGEITVESAPGRTVFQVRLPLLEED